MKLESSNPQRHTANKLSRNKALLMRKQTEKKITLQTPKPFNDKITELNFKASITHSVIFLLIYAAMSRHLHFRILLQKNTRIRFNLNSIRQGRKVNLRSVKIKRFSRIAKYKRLVSKGNVYFKFRHTHFQTIEPYMAQTNHYLLHERTI